MDFQIVINEFDKYVNYSKMNTIDKLLEFLKNKNLMNKNLEENINNFKIDLETVNLVCEVPKKSPQKKKEIKEESDDEENIEEEKPIKKSQKIITLNDNTFEDLLKIHKKKKNGCTDIIFDFSNTDNTLTMSLDKNIKLTYKFKINDEEIIFVVDKNIRKSSFLANIKIFIKNYNEQKISDIFSTYPSDVEDNYNEFAKITNNILTNKNIKSIEMM